MRNDARGGLRRAWLVTLALAVSAFEAGPSVRAAKVETWRQDTASAFSKGKRDKVVVSDSGRIRLGQALKGTEKLDATHVWDLARTADGVVYAATGDAGKVFKRKGDGPWTVAYDGEDSQALALAVLPDGRVFVGTGPTGQVVEATGDKHPASRPHPGVQYIWDLAADKAGNLYAATGPTGQLWKRAAADGAWSLVFDSKHSHLLCVAVGPDGSVYAGSDGEGILYRVGPDGRTSVVYDAPQNEIRALFFGPDDALYVGTAEEAGGSPRGGPGRGLSFLSEPVAPSTVAPDPNVCGPVLLAEAEPAQLGRLESKPAVPGENAVYRVGPDGVPREVFRSKVLIFALAWRKDSLVIGAGPDGQLFEVRDRMREWAPIARLDHGQVLSLLGDPKGELLIGAGDPGAVLALTPGHVAAGTFTSDVHDSKWVSRFGAVAWKGESHGLGGPSMTVQLRTGNVGEPDATWSDWSAPMSDPTSSRANVPPGRFSQYRVNLSTTDPNASPEFRSISIRYQTVNLPPEIAKLDVPDVGEADGATRQNKLALKWTVSDPNDDDMEYTVAVRKEGWPEWIQIGGEAPLTDKSYSWDVSAFPSGIYEVRLSASDRPSNDPAEAQSRRKVSEPFIVDHQPPTVTVSATNGKKPGATAQLKDDLTRIVKAAYSLDGGDWSPVFPGDGLFDAPRETIKIDLPDLKPGMHVLMVRATDAAGNVGVGDTLLKGP